MKTEMTHTKAKEGITWKILAGVLGLVLILSVISSGKFWLSSSSGDEAADKAVSFIKDNLGYTAKVVGVQDKNGLYNIKLDIQGQEYTSYITKDGKIFFPSGYDLEATPESPITGATTKEVQEVPKTDKPVANAFVMAYCPYGLQFLKAYVQVMETLKDKAELNLNFVSYAMHGKKELDENTRMYCIQKEQKEKLTAYLRCFVESDDSAKCITNTQIDKTKLDACVATTDKEFKITELFNDQSTWMSGKYPQYNVDKVLADKYGVQGSPTFILNGQDVSVDRSADAIKKAICDAFNTSPQECSQSLSTSQEAPGIGKIGSATTTSGSAGSCN